MSVHKSICAIPWMDIYPIDTSFFKRMYLGPEVYKMLIISFKCLKQIALFQKISIPLTQVFLVLTPTPLEIISSFVSYFLLKILAFETPLPLGISNEPPWGGYGYFL